MLIDNPIRKQKIDEYLSKGEIGYYGSLRDPNDRAEKMIDQLFGQIRITLKETSMCIPRETPISEFFTRLNPIAERMAAIIKRESNNYLYSVMVERDRRLDGKEPHVFDEVGEWLIENGQVSENCMLSIIGDVVDRHRNLYERLGNEAMQIIQDLPGLFVFRKYWKMQEYGKVGEYAVDAENYDTEIHIRVGCVCRRVSTENFD